MKISSFLLSLFLFFSFNQSVFALSRSRTENRQQKKTENQQQKETENRQQKETEKQQKKTENTPETSEATTRRGTVPDTANNTGTGTSTDRGGVPRQTRSLASADNRSRSTDLPSRDSKYFYSDRIDLLTPEQRRELDERHLNARCTTKHGEERSCGYREKWSYRGDPYFTWDPYFNQIEPGTPVDIEVKCDEKTKRFYTNVSLNHCTKNERGQKTCKKKYFSNPYASCSVNERGFEICQKDYVSKRNTLSDRPQNWLTSPGLYLGDMKTRLPPVTSRTQGGDEVKLVAQDHHVAGSNAIYEGARIPNVVWLNKNGNAFHGSRYVDGRPRSQGCLRLSQENAHALYRLARRVGTKNFTVRWMGYGSTQSDGRPACAQSMRWNREIALHFARYFQQGKHRQAALDLEREIYRLAEIEGRTPVMARVQEEEESHLLEADQ